MAQISPTLISTLDPPVMEAFGWLKGLDFPRDRPLISLSQAAPSDPPPLAIREALADAALNNPDAHFYGPVLGMPALRDAVAAHTSKIYAGDISAEDVAITAGCNQAFCTAISTVAAAGDEVILVTPWYFNHKMWLDMAQITSVPLPVGSDMLPDTDAAANLMTDKTRAIVLVSPNNPTGAEYPDDLLQDFAQLCQNKGIALILDETYRDFLSHDGKPHSLFDGSDWRGTLFHLYSFSKVYRLTGHRVGALIADRGQIAQAEKILDTVTICANQLGQIAALHGVSHLGDWAKAQAQGVRARREIVEAGFAALPSLRLLSCGAYFTYFEHDEPGGSDAFAQRLIKDASLLMLPGRMFGPNGDQTAQNKMRMAFANADQQGLNVVFERLAKIT